MPALGARWAPGDTGLWPVFSDQPGLLSRGTPEIKLCPGFRVHPWGPAVPPLLFSSQGQPGSLSPRPGKTLRCLCPSWPATPATRYTDPLPAASPRPGRGSSRPWVPRDDAGPDRSLWGRSSRSRVPDTRGHPDPGTQKPCHVAELWLHRTRPDLALRPHRRGRAVAPRAPLALHSHPPPRVGFRWGGGGLSVIHKGTLLQVGVGGWVNK